MRLVVISDTHGNIERLYKVIDQQRKADIFIFLGDYESDMEEAKPFYPGKQFLIVAGNCDFGSGYPTEAETILAGKRIFYAHGHNYYVKSGPSMIIGEARRRNVDILLYGHTHVAYTTYDNGLYIMNPGSVGRPAQGKPTYGIVDITNAGIVTYIVEV